MFSLPKDKENLAHLWWLPSAEAIIFVIVFYLSLYVMPYLINSDGDLGRHITIGSVLLDSGQIIRTDIFSHTMLGEKLILHEWLSDLLFAKVYLLYGLNGIAWLTSLTLAGTYALFTAGLKWLNIRTPVRFIAGILAFLVGINHWHTRPHIITTFLFTYLLLSLAYYAKTEQRKVLFPIPFVMVLWANLHGAFITGLVQIGLFSIGLLLDKKYEATKTVFILLLISIIATLLNPFGAEMITHGFGYLQLDYLVDITNEYKSPNFHHSIMWPFLGTLLLTIVVGWNNKVQKSGLSLVLLLFWTASALYSARNVPLYGQVAALFLATQIDQSTQILSGKANRFLTISDQTGKRASGWLWSIAFSAFLMISQAQGRTFDLLGEGNQFSPESFPVQAINDLEDTAFLEGNVFNDFGWGGYLLYRLWPNNLVFIDGQTDFYGENLTYIHQQTITGQGDWQYTLDQYNIDWVILPPHLPLAKLLSKSDDWKRVYSDNTSLVFTRKQLSH
jgi:hypothetical membrane protein